VAILDVIGKPTILFMAWKLTFPAAALMVIRSSFVNQAKLLRRRCFKVRFTTTELNVGVLTQRRRWTDPSHSITGKRVEFAGLQRFQVNVAARHGKAPHFTI
jgi:hypothetical protein